VSGSCGDVCAMWRRPWRATGGGGGALPLEFLPARCVACLNSRPSSTEQAPAPFDGDTFGDSTAIYGDWVVASAPRYGLGVGATYGLATSSSPPPLLSPLPQ
jgi:hypothetical protein